MTNIHTVIFDVGNVLINWDPRNLYTKLFNDDGTAMEAFLAEICTTEWNIQQDLGRSWRDAVDELTARFPEHRELIRAFDTRWMEMVPGTIEGSVEILRSLKRRGLPIYGLTNFSAEKFKLARNRFDFFTEFDGIVVSADERMIKPDPAIYEVLLARYDVAPRESIFIDDSPPNIATAEGLGMTGHLFRSPGSLAGHLTELGLLD